MNSYIYDIKSIGYNVLHYPINTTCTYKMTGIGDYGFKFVFNEFDLENSTGCENDKLSIYRGADSTSESNLIAKRCGRNRSELVSTSNQLTAQFITNSQISNTGFHISVYGKSDFLPVFELSEFSRFWYVSSNMACDLDDS